jgi:iron complex outermembrane recepter protein
VPDTVLSHSEGTSVNMVRSAGARRWGAFSLLALGLNHYVQADEEPDTVIVTGTRETGLTAYQSTTPVRVIQAQDLVATGRGNLLDALKDILPSINTPAVPYDVGALARTFQLRGLAPGQTLVLVNGKRRHVSASLYADSDPAQGSNAVDLDLIPLAAIDHIEVLQDGAAAQYGSDAIAGVINIILKDSGEGAQLSALGGAYQDGGGGTGEVNADGGIRLPGDGTLHLSAGYRSHQFSNRSGDSGGPQPAHVQGDPRTQLVSAAYDSNLPFSQAVTLYSFGTVAHRNARAYENPRQPGATGVDQVDVLYPNGFSPLERARETDFGATAGAKGDELGPWRWDISVTYGRNQVDLDNIDTVNPDLLADQGNAQSRFSVGSFNSSDLSTNLDVRRTFELPLLAAPLNFAVGLEQRRETFDIGAGEPNSYYGGGPAAFPGFRPSDGANASRSSFAGYLDLSAHLTSTWEVGLAGRAEHYQSVGSKQTGKLSTRWEITPQLAWRATLSNGFHAPTLAQQYYSATTVTTGFATIQVPLGSAGARVLGAPNLRPETSRNFSTGLVLQPLPNLHASLDFYQIDLNDRIIETGYISGDIVAETIAANGSIIPSGVSGDNVSAAFFTNGVDTRTRGIDLAVDYSSLLGDLGAVRWTANVGYNKTEIREIHAAPEVLQAQGTALLDAVQISNLTTATPHVKASVAAVYTGGPWEATVRESYYGNSTQVQGYGPYYSLDTGTAFITDLQVSYGFNRHVRLGVGADNLFNRYPDRISPAVYQNLNYDQYSHLSPYGIDGAYYYGRLTVTF